MEQPAWIEPMLSSVFALLDMKEISARQVSETWLCQPLWDNTNFGRNVRIHHVHFQRIRSKSSPMQAFKIGNLGR